MSKHTPGPWSLDRTKIISSSKGKVADVVILGYQNIGYRDEETCANARLIATAPEMLEALVSFVEAETEWLGLNDPEAGIVFDDPLSDAYEKARAVIAKAKGNMSC